MGVQRDSIIKGPGLVKLGTVVLHSKDTITSELATETEKNDSAIFGKLSSHITDQTGKTTLTPVGVITADILSLLYPAAYKTPTIGASIFGASDVACEVHSKAGQKLTWISSALTNMPEILLSARKTAIGSTEITHVLKNDADRTTADSMYTLAAAAYTDSGFSESDMKQVPYTAAWGSVLTGIQAKEGWTITPTLEIEALESDDLGTIDFYLKNVSITAKCRPLGFSEANILDNLPTGMNIGSIPSGNDLTISGVGGLTVVLKNAVLLEGPLQYGNTELRAGEIMFSANPDVAAGGALFTVALTV